MEENLSIVRCPIVIFSFAYGVTGFVIIVFIVCEFSAEAAKVEIPLLTLYCHRKEILGHSLILVVRRFSLEKLIAFFFRFKQAFAEERF